MKDTYICKELPRMDISKFIEGLGLAKGAVELLKGAKDLLPDSPKKEAAALALRLAEQTFRIAETQAAQELGYPLCDCTWPPPDCVAAAG